MWNFSNIYEEQEILEQKPSEESLDQEKHFKHVLGVGIGKEFKEMRIKIKNI